jgi:two-component system, LytTR family, response regulator
MTSPDPPTVPAAPRRPPTVASLWIGGVLLLWALYTVVFMGTELRSLAAAAQDALANVLPLALLAVGVRAVLKAEVMQRRPALQVVWHAGLAVGFAFLWYASLIVVLALLSGARGRGFAVAGFSGPALTWQTFQGLILYAAIAATCYAVRGGREAATVTLVAPAPVPPPLVRYLIRTGDEITPVEVDEIVSIAGAQDYAEVSTLRGRHLVRLSLNELEARLDPQSFVRVHRSAIINLRRLERAEPAGAGRLIAHMSTGEVVQVSRTGAQALRRLIV